MVQCLFFYCLKYKDVIAILTSPVCVFETYKNVNKSKVCRVAIDIFEICEDWNW